MSYDPNVPQSGDTLGGTRAQIQQNFADINTHFQVNHVDFNSSGAGKHPFLQMPEQSSSPTTAANEGGLYVKEAGTAASSTLFFREESNGTELQLIDPDRTVSTTGSLTLPGGLIMKWGRVNTPGTSGTVTFATAFPTAIFQVQLTIRSNTNTGRIATVNGATPPTTADFRYRLNAASASTVLYWYAIGN